MPLPKCPGISDCQRNWKTIVVSAISTTTLGSIAWSQIPIPRWWCFERGLLDGRSETGEGEQHGCQQKATPVNPPKKWKGFERAVLVAGPNMFFFLNCKENPMGNGSQISVKTLQFDSCLQNVPVWISWGCLRRGYFGACPKPRCCKWRGNLTTCKQVSNMLEHVAVLKPFLVVTENASRQGLLWGDMKYIYYIYIRSTSNCRYDEYIQYILYMSQLYPLHSCQSWASHEQIRQE